MNDPARLNEVVSTLGIAPYWSAYRPGVPDEVADVLVGAARRGGGNGSLLDLGTGTGEVVRALHPHFRDIIAVDPVQDLLDQAERALGPLIPAKVRLVRCPAEEFTPPAGWTAALVTICRAFHWMNRSLVLRRLAPIVAPSGVLAIFRDGGFWGSGDDLWARPLSPWKDALRTVIHDFAGRRGPRRPRPTGPDVRARPHGEIFAGSAFTDIEKVTVPVRRVWTSESILGYLYSTPYAARPLFGDRVGEFEAAVRRVLADHSAGDAFVEDDEFVIWLARKGPDERPRRR